MIWLWLTLVLFLGVFIGIMLTMGSYAVALKSVGERSYDNLMKKDPKPTSALERMIKELETIGSVKYRLHKAFDINDEQARMASLIVQPNKNASHSRYKNEMIGTFKAMEAEKLELLKSILKDGYDLTLVVNSDGTKRNIKLSDYVASIEGGPPLEEVGREPEVTVQKPKLTVVRTKKEET
jgi:hypothetical protein